jgi:hypothetical protein
VVLVVRKGTAGLEAETRIRLRAGWLWLRYAVTVDKRTKSMLDGYRRHFSRCTLEELIAAFNSGVGCNAWVSARAAYLHALREALLGTGLDCSAFISDMGMPLRHEVERRGGSIVVR